MAEETAVAAPVVEAKKKVKKLSKVIAGNILTIKEAVTGSTLTFDAGTLPKEIQAKLMPYGLSQKLGDAAAGKEGKEAIDSINKVWDGLVKNDWTVRAPAAEKVNTSSILTNYNAMPEGPKKNLAKAMLQDLGLLPKA